MKGYDISVQGPYLVTGHVPYRTLNNIVRDDGQLVAKLTLQDDIAVQPENHVIDFISQAPCNAQGQRYDALINSEGPFALTDTPW